MKIFFEASPRAILLKKKKSEFPWKYFQVLKRSLTKIKAQRPASAQLAEFVSHPLMIPRCGKSAATDFASSNGRKTECIRVHKFCNENLHLLSATMFSCRKRRT